MLYIGEKVGAAQDRGPEDRHRARSARGHDDHRQGRRQRAGRARHRRAGLPAQRARRLHGQARGRPRLSRGRDRPRNSPTDNVRAVAAAKGVEPSEIIACVLDRPRHEKLIAELRALGCGIQLIPDGDVAGVIAATDPDTGIDIYMGSGGAPEGVLAAAALRCVGGQFQGRLLFRNDDERAPRRPLGHRGSQPHLPARGARQGRRHLRRDRRHRRLAARRRPAPQGQCITTESVVMRASTGTVRWVSTEYRDLEAARALDPQIRR